uniref:Large ribosomal subunit protein bL12 C-terminal domain-containing protein n=1 Tax=Entomoneis paludosa TaxID=265537 RepID=A0A7S3DXJ9_9STRA
MISAHLQRRSRQFTDVMLSRHSRGIGRTASGITGHSHPQQHQQVAGFHGSVPTAANELEKINLAKRKEAPPIQWTTHLLKKEQIEKVDRLFHKILWLDMVETHMLNTVLNERWGLKVTPKQNKAIDKLLDNQLMDSVGQGGGGGGAAEAAAVEDAGPKLMELKLTGFDAKSKIKVIKEVRAIAGLGLKEAKEMVESAPTIIQKDLNKEQAEETKAKLAELGAEVEIL